MKTKNLALVGGILGIVGGIILLFGPFFVLGSVAADIADSDSLQVRNTAIISIIFLLLKVAILIIGIITIIYYKGSEVVKSAPSVLLIVAGGVALVPFLGFVGGIIAIIGGGIFLASLKNFKVDC